MGSGASANNDKEGRKTITRIKYRNGRPRVCGDEVIGCFRTIDENGKLVSPPGLLYRIVLHSKRQWYFYNDTKEFKMVVTGYFDSCSDIKALGKATMWSETPNGLLIIELIVLPMQTEPFLEGLVMDGFDLRFRAVPH